MEIADLLTKSRGKFSQANPDYQKFFVVCSEIISRSVEDMKSTLGHKSAKEVLNEFNACNRKTNLLEILRRTNVVSSDLNDRFFSKRLNTILIYPYDVESESYVRVRTITDTRQAIEEYDALEKKYEGTADVVMVRAEDTKTIMKVFQNYFTDASDFVRYIDAGLDRLKYLSGPNAI